MFRTSLKIIISLIVGTGIFSACSSVQEENNPTRTAMLADPPREFVNQVELAFRKKVAFIDDKEIDAYLSRLSMRLFSPGKYEIHVALVSTASAGYVPSVWVVPGGMIFFDVRVLRTLHFENEIAAAIALAWERAAGTEFRARMIEEASHTDSDPMRIWTFSRVENERAIESAVDRIYKAGYDPRGLVSYFERVSTKSGNQIESETAALKDKARRAVAFYAPLLNPIVRTEDFYKMRKRLERL